MAQNSARQRSYVIQTRGLTKQFGNETAVDRLSFDVPQGLIFGLIGPSGCGKTTTVRLLTGVLEPTQGEAYVLGQEPRHFAQATRARIGYMLQHSVLYPNLTVWENLNFASAIYGVGPVRGKRLRRVLDFVELNEHRKKTVDQISGGMLRRLSLAATLAHDPTLIFLDEPTTGVDPVLRRKFWDHFVALRDEGRTLIVTTQYVGEAAYCDLVGVMQGGRMLMVETPEGLRRATYGGDMVEIQSVTYLEPQRVEMVRQVESVRDATRLSATHLRLVVDEAGTAIPRLMEWTQAQNIEIESIQEYQTPFDDVFVDLIERRARQDNG